MRSTTQQRHQAFPEIGQPATEAFVPAARGSDTAGAGPVLTVLVPTRNEAGNVVELLRRTTAALAGRTVEVLFVDDSDDGTQDVVASQPSTAGLQVRVLHRPPEQRTGGLGGAVVAGLGQSRAPWVCIMDADLQHPPERLPDLLAAAEGGNVDLVVASRYVGEGSKDGLSSAARRAISVLSTTLSRALFPGRLRAVTDPMSGFFLVRRAAIDLDSLRPCGFKVLLEILVRTGHLRVVEVPFTFASRFSGASNASVREGFRFLRTLVRLRGAAVVSSGPVRRAIGFGLVGLSGLAVNVAALWLLSGRTTLGLPYLLGAMLATQVSTVWNFLLVDRWVFRGRAVRSARVRFLSSMGLNNAALVFRLPALWALVTLAGTPYLMANIATLLVLFAARFAVTDRVVYRVER